MLRSSSEGCGGGAGARSGEGGGDGGCSDIEWDECAGYTPPVECDEYVEAGYCVFVFERCRPQFNQPCHFSTEISLSRNSKTTIQNARTAKACAIADTYQVSAGANAVAGGQLA